MGSNSQYLTFAQYNNEPIVGRYVPPPYQGAPQGGAVPSYQINSPYAQTPSSFDSTDTWGQPWMQQPHNAPLSYNAQMQQQARGMMQQRSTMMEPGLVENFDYGSANSPQDHRTPVIGTSLMDTSGMEQHKSGFGSTTSAVRRSSPIPALERPPARTMIDGPASGAIIEYLDTKQDGKQMPNVTAIDSTPPGTGYGAFNADTSSDGSNFFVPPAQDQMDASGLLASGRRPLFIECSDAARHVSQCEICNRIYQNNTKLYIGIIIFLCLIIILFLLKSVLEIRRPINS